VRENHLAAGSHSTSSWLEIKQTDGAAWIDQPCEVLAVEWVKVAGVARECTVLVAVFPPPMAYSHGDFHPVVALAFFAQAIPAIDPDAR